MTARHPPGPKIKSPLGIVPWFRRDPLGCVASLFRDYGGFVTIPGPMYVSSFLLNDPDLIRPVLVEQADKFEKPSIFKKVFRSAFGNGLFFSEGEFWKRQRRLIQPAFHHKRIEAYADGMVRHARQLLETWRPGQQRVIDADMRALTLKIVVDAIFHTDITDYADRFGQSLARLAQAVSAQSVSPVQALLPDWAPTPLLMRKRRAAAELDAIVYAVIGERRRSGVDTGDLLSVLLLAVDESDDSRMTDRQVHDEVLTIFIAGHETTALTLAWAFALLAQHSDVEAKLHAELDRVLGARPPSLADLDRLAYAEMIVKETLRLYPPAWIIFRQPLVDIELGGYRLKKGAIIWITPYVVHRDSRYYDEPDRFVPERFAPDASGEGLEKRLPKFAYFPFGGGPRICIGNGFAMLEARLLLATIAQRYRLELPPGHRVEVSALATLGFKGGLAMRLIAR